jgi:hypothetical protein
MTERELVEAARSGDEDAFRRADALHAAWSKLKALAHTLLYDATLLGDTGQGKPLGAVRWRSETVPTLAVDVGTSPAWMRAGVKALADVLPNARQRTLDGKTHLVKTTGSGPGAGGVLPRLTGRTGQTPERTT